MIVNTKFGGLIMATEAQTCAIDIITIFNILVALYLSIVFYKSALFMQNKPNLPAPQMNVGSVLTKDYENQGRLQTPGKQTQSNPISKAAPMLLCAALLRTKFAFGESGHTISKIRLRRPKPPIP